jgi:uncharacterized membrane protein
MARHPADLLSLTFGLVFAAIGLMMLTDSTDWRSFDWVGPLAAIILGAVLMLMARSSGAARDEESTEA